MNSVQQMRRGAQGDRDRDKDRDKDRDRDRETEIGTPDLAAQHVVEKEAVAVPSPPTA